MILLDRIRIKRNPRLIEFIKNPSDELIKYAISCGYIIGYPDRENFSELCTHECFLEKFKKDPTFLDNLKKFGFSINLKPIYKIVFDSNPTQLLNFYNYKIFNNIDYVSSIIDIEIIYIYIIENYRNDEIPQEVFNNKNIINTEENIIQRSNIESIINFLEKAKTISNNIIRLLEKKILENPMDYFYNLNTIIGLLEKNEKDFSKEFYTKYKESIIDKPIYTDNMPSYLKIDQEYIESFLIQNPKTDSIELYYFLSASAKEKIISKIREEHIIFETIPKIYLLYEDIYFEIIKNNNKVSNIIEITKSNWSVEKLHRLLEYTSYKYHEQTPKEFYEDTKYFMDELKKDFSITRYAPSDLNLSLKEITEIFELYINQKDVKINDSELLKANPFVVINELKEGNINIKDIDISKIKYKEIIGHELQKYEIDNSKTDSKFDNIDNYLYIPANDIETIKKYVELKENNLLNYTIVFKTMYIHYNTFLISDNINYFKTIKDKKDIYFSFDGEKLLSLDQIIKDDEFLDYCVQNIKNSDMSPFEKYLAIYDIVKNFKKYNKRPDDILLQESRNLYMILNNNYIVCAGYARLLETLLKRIGIDATFLISPTYRDDIQHAIVALKIKDEKYNLDGVYLSDPTDDNPQFTSIREVNHYHGVLFRLKDTPLKEDYKDAETVDAQNREQAIDKDTLLSAVMTVKKRIFKNLSHAEELELTLATGLKTGKNKEQLEKELNDLKIGLYKSCLNKKISEVKTIKYSDYVAEILSYEISEHLAKYNDVDLWYTHLFDDFTIAFRKKENYTEEQSIYINDDNNINDDGSVYYTKKIVISPDSTINDVLNDLDFTLKELKQLGIIDAEVNENKNTLHN